MTKITKKAVEKLTAHFSPQVNTKGLMPFEKQEMQPV